MVAILFLYVVEGDCVRTIREIDGRQITEVYASLSFVIKMEVLAIALGVTVCCNYIATNCGRMGVSIQDPSMVRMIYK